MKVRGGVRLILLAWLTAGCMVWTPRPLGAPLADSDQLKGWVRVNLTTGPSLEMKGVRITADSVTGLRDDSAIERVAIPRSQVVSIERRAFSRERTAILLLATAVGAVVVAYVAVLLSMASGSYT